MSYTINPNAKNKWARNAENTMDLSLETDASSVYLDNGRTLEQEIGEGSMVSNVATVDSAMSKVIDGTLDGAYESLVFKGKSLVNLFDKSEIATNHASYTIGTDNTISFVANNGFTNGVDLSHLKPNTKYALFFDVLAVSQEPDIPYRINDDGTNYNINIFGRDQGNPTSGFHSFTTGSDVSDLKFFFYTNLRNVGFKLTLPVIIEYQQGMENLDIPYFTGICDVKMPILRNLSSECSTLSDMENGTITGSNGVNASNTEPRSRTKGKKKLNGASSILFSDNLLGVQKYLFSYDSNGSYLGRTPSNWGTENEIPVVEGAHYYRVAFAEHFENLPRSMYIVPKDHKTNILHTLETVTLRSLPSGVRDTYNARTGEYVKRIGEVTLDGSEKYVRDGSSTKPTDLERFSTPIRDMVSSPYNTGNFVVGTSGYNIVNNDKISPRKLPNIWNYYQANIYLDFAINAFGMTTSDSVDTKISKLKTYLASNPITIYYELETPITTTIEPLSIPFAYENGHIVLESGYEGQSLLPTLEYSTVINRTGQIQSIANTVQKQEKQITKLEQMLIQNIINLDYNNTLLTLKNEMEEML